MVARYQKRISGPLIDRIDIHVDVLRVNYEKLSGQRLGEPSSAVRERVTAARQRQRERFTHTRLLTNADMGPAEVREHCQLDEASTASSPTRLPWTSEKSTIRIGRLLIEVRDERLRIDLPNPQSLISRPPDINYHKHLLDGGPSLPMVEYSQQLPQPLYRQERPMNKLHLILVNSRPTLCRAFQTALIAATST